MNTRPGIDSARVADPSIHSKVTGKLGGGEGETDSSTEFRCMLVFRAKHFVNSIIVSKPFQSCQLGRVRVAFAIHGSTSNNYMGARDPLRTRPRAFYKRPLGPPAPAPLALCCLWTAPATPPPRAPSRRSADMERLPDAAPDVTAVAPAPLRATAPEPLTRPWREVTRTPRSST